MVSTSPPPTPAPTVSITSEPSSTTTATNASFAWQGTNASGYTCKLDSGAASACTSPKSYSGLAQGSHTFVVTATGAGGTAQDTLDLDDRVERSPAASASAAASSASPATASASPAPAASGDAGRRGADAAE